MKALTKRSKQLPTLVISLLCLAASIAGAQQWNGYTLICTEGSTSATLVDTNGTTYHSWILGSVKTGYSAYMEKGGTLIRSIQTTNQLNGAAMCGAVQRVDWNGNQTWLFKYSSSTYCTHHDFCPMPNGNVLLISYDVKTAAQATQAGCSRSTSIWPDKIVEIRQTGATTGEVVWEWCAWDHLCQSVNSAKDNYVSNVADHPELLNINYNTQQDWMHMNGIDYNEELDQIAFSCHNLNEIFVIDHSTTTDLAKTHQGGNSGKGGDILYRWGNPAAYGKTGTKVLNVVHDVHWVPQGHPYAGCLAAFNNGGTSGKSTIDIVNAPRNGYTYTRADGAAFEPASYTYRRICSGKSNNMGSSEQFPNGNMMICVAQSGLVYEIDSLGTTLWSKSYSGVVPQAHRYTPEFLAGSSITATASISDKLICPGEQVQLSVSVSGATDATFSWTSTPAGLVSTEQNPTHSPTETTTYRVVARSGADSAVSTTTVTVSSIPDKPTITRFGNTIECSQATSYEWYLNGNKIESATAQALIPTENGVYTAIVINAAGCKSDVSEGFAVDFVSVDESIGAAFSIYPNPTNGIVSIRSALPVKISVTDALGRTMLESAPSDQIDLSGFENGVYFVRANDGQSRYTAKVVLVK